jgi:hypothetical protein
MIPLRAIAFARSGDKGDSANIAVFGRSTASYLWMREHLEAPAVEDYFRALGVGRVIRYDVPNLEALNFVLPHVLGGGGSRSLRIDAQGKTLGMALLEMLVDVPRHLIPADAVTVSAAAIPFTPH